MSVLQNTVFGYNLMLILQFCMETDSVGADT